MIPFCKETGIGLVPWFSLNVSYASDPILRPLKVLQSGRLARPVSQQDQSTRKEFTKNMLGEMGSADEEIIGRVEQVAKSVTTDRLVVLSCLSMFAPPPGE